MRRLDTGDDSICFKFISDSVCVFSVCVHVCACMHVSIVGSRLGVDALEENMTRAWHCGTEESWMKGSCAALKPLITTAGSLALRGLCQ